MIVIEKQEHGYLTYSDDNKKIKKVYDRLEEPIRENAIYDDAFDIEVEGKPRFDYEETETPIDVEVGNNEIVDMGKQNGLD